MTCIRIKKISKNILSFITLVLLSISNSYAVKKLSFNLTRPQLDAIGQQIWQNEAGKQINMLTCWNTGEDCASLGIGHFIWYPRSHTTNFEQTFPKLIAFLRTKKVAIPRWLSADKVHYCPWPNRTAFYQAINSTKMTELRNLLQRTIAQQTDFIIQQAKYQLEKLRTHIPRSQQRTIDQYLQQLLADPRGIYAVIDYINFKGLGLKKYKDYQNYSWGLYRVLCNIKQSIARKDICQAFIKAAEEVLTKRVQCAPKNRNEARWLPGWKKRLATYATFQLPTSTNRKQ